MQLHFKESFEKDVASITDVRVKNQIKKLLFRLEGAASLTEIPNVKKLAGNKNFYRIRLGDYRIGIMVNGRTITVVRVLHRKEIYRYFP